MYFGANEDPGNTDETSKFPSAVALIWRWTGDDAFRDEMYDFRKRGMRYVVDELDEDGDGWPEGLGNVERPGMGEEKLDNTVYTIRGLRDLADMAHSKGDTATAEWAAAIAADMEQRFEAAWWYGGDARPVRRLARPTPTTRGCSSATGSGSPRWTRCWCGPGSRPARWPATSTASTALEQRERPCYTGGFGLYHTGTGPTSAPSGQPRARAATPWCRACRASATCSR